MAATQDSTPQNGESWIPQKGPSRRNCSITTFLGIRWAENLFLKIFWRTLFCFVGPLTLLFWTSSDICPGFQSQGGSLACKHCCLHALYSSDSPLMQHLLTSWWQVRQLSHLIHILADVYRLWWDSNPGLCVPHGTLCTKHLSHTGSAHRKFILNELIKASYLHSHAFSLVSTFRTDIIWNIKAPLRSVLDRRPNKAHMFLVTVTAINTFTGSRSKSWDM